MLMASQPGITKIRSGHDQQASTQSFSSALRCTFHQTCHAKRLQQQKAYTCKHTMHALSPMHACMQHNCAEARQALPHRNRNLTQLHSPRPHPGRATHPTVYCKHAAFPLFWSAASTHVHEQVAKPYTSTPVSSLKALQSCALHAVVPLKR
jgi:hypothetical protein